MKTNDRRIALSSWKFQLDQQDFGEQDNWQSSSHSHDGWLDVQAGQAWDFYEYALRNYEGIGWYYTEFPALDAGDRCHLVEFTGVGGVCKVWINGRLAGENDSRYLPFSVDAEPFLRRDGCNSIAVKVDNSFRGADHLTGGKDIEWVLYGGLTHKVELVAAARCRVSHLWIKAECDGTAQIRATVKNDSQQDFSGSLELVMEEISDCKATAKLSCPAGESVAVELSLEARGITPWSPDEPALYHLAAVLCDGTGGTIHTARERIGFRTIERRGSELFLNGDPLFLKGANRYDEYEPYGPLPPAELIREDLMNMKRCGMNLVRTHYAQDPIHYEIADEIGIMYMLEVPLNWWFPDEAQELSDFPALQAEAIDNLDRTFYHFCNHPCWTIWSMSNECGHNTKAGYAMFKMLADRARSYEGGRLITNVTCVEIKDSEELAYCDFIAVNTYHGTTEDKISNFPQKAEKASMEHMKRVQSLYPDYPLVMTEFGGNSVRGLRGDAGRFTEEQHAENLRAVCRGFLQVEHMRGLVLWSWADYFHHRKFISYGMHIQAPFGPYGVVTVDRKIKNEPYNAICEIFSECP